jgi:phenylacetic acid degradation operon negative regulatory protein
MQHVTQERNSTGADGEGRPLTARSVVASVLLGMRTPELSAQRLVATAGLFGLEPGTTRVALSRMVAAGELDAAEGRYRLAGPLLDRQRRQDESRRAAVKPWSGQWTVALAPAGARPAAERAALRKTMHARKLAPWRDGMWTRPDNLERGPSGEAGGRARSDGCVWLTATLASGVSDRDLAAQLWDLDRWAQRVARLREEMAATVGQLKAGEFDALAPCFVIAAGVVRQVVADPLLPPELLPARWPGAGLRADYDRYERAYQRLLRSWLTDLQR